MKRLLRHPIAQTALAHVLGTYLAFALRTTRWRLVGGEEVAHHFSGAPAIVAFWHERLPLMPALWVLARTRAAGGNKPVQAHVLVSQHRDGRFIGAVVRRFGIATVLGSSSRGGSAGLRRLASLLAEGDHVGITPDGPRGPRRRAAPGVAQLAALSGVAVVPCGAQTTRRRVLRRTWDQMTIPRPFGRGVMVCGTPIVLAREGWADRLPEIEAAITRATQRADELCGT